VVLEREPLFEKGEEKIRWETLSKDQGDTKGLFTHREIRNRPWKREEAHGRSSRRPSVRNGERKKDNKKTPSKYPRKGGMEFSVWELNKGKGTPG